jgi:RNA polymerase sigma factor (sigma-70 family)
MTPDDSFQQLLRRVRAGDGSAEAELVRMYEPYVRRAARIRLRQPRLRRLLDSLDVCQLVLASFFLGLQQEQYQLDTEEQLVKLLQAMARNKVADHARREHADCRDVDRLEAGGVAGLDVADPAMSPSQQVVLAELLQKVPQLLSPKERLLADRRLERREWAEVGAELGESPEALRKQFDRAVQRILEWLNPWEASHE